MNLEASRRRKVIRSLSLLPLLMLAALPVVAAQAAAKATSAPPDPLQAPLLATPTPAPGAVAQFSGEITPPDGKWLKDEQGREYFPETIPRVEGQYRWIDDEKKSVRLAYGLMFDVISYNDKEIVIKIYRPVAREAKGAGRRLTPEQIAAIAAGYVFKTAESDQLAFAEFDRGLPRAGQWRQSFSVADINADGHLDIVHGPARKTGSRPAIFLGNGAGEWRPWQEVRFPDRAFDYGDADTADLDGDGDLDLVLASHLKGLSALRHDGRGGFELWSDGLDFWVQASRPDPPFSSRAVSLADWNGDGRPDIVAVGEGPRLAGAPSPGNSPRFQTGPRGVSVFLNRGDGTWERRVSEETSALYADDVMAVDVNGDGVLDILTGSAVQGYPVLLHLGQPDGSWRAHSFAGLRDHATVRGIAVGDFDADGRRDLVISFLSREGEVWRTGFDLFLSKPDGSWERRPVWNEEGREGLTALAAGDLDGDGRRDLVALTGSGNGWVFLGDGKGGFRREASPEVRHGEVGCGGAHVELVDLDRDGRDEIVAGFAGEGGGLFGKEACPSGGSLRVWRLVEPAGKPQR